MINNYGDMSTGTPYGTSLTDLALANLFLGNESEFEKRLNGLDDKTRRMVREHMDEFQTVEEMEMFIKQKTNGRDNFS